MTSTEGKLNVTVASPKTSVNTKKTTDKYWRSRNSAVDTIPLHSSYQQSIVVMSEIKLCANKAITY